MKKYFKIVFVLVTIFFYNEMSFGQKGKIKPPTKKKIATVVGASDTQMNFSGKFEGSKYTNPFFGFKITMPENWIIQEKDVNDAIKKIGEEQIKGKTKQVQGILDEAVQRVTVLFTTSKDIFGMADNAALILGAEKMSPLTKIRNGNDYMRLTLQSYKLMQLPPDYQYSENILTEKFNTEVFSYIDIQRTGYKQRVYATARKSYALFFTVQFVKQKDLDTMREVLEKTDFNWKP